MELQDFLDKLELQVEVTPAMRGQVDHVAELLAHSAEFNLNGQAHTTAELDSLLQTGQADCRVVQVRDRFGDYGTAGAVLLSLHDETLNVDSFVLNCRVLGKGVEQATWRQINGIAQQQGASRIQLHYCRTPRNSATFQFLKSLGSDGLDEKLSELDLVVPVGPELAHADRDYQSDKRPTGASALADLLGGRLTALDPQQRTELMTRLSGERVDARTILADIRQRKQRVRPELFQTPFVAPRTPIETRLAEIWSEVLGITPIGVHDDFFELGGHSLLATRLISLLEETFKLDLGLACLFQAPTVESLANSIQEQQAQAANYTELPLVTPHPDARFDPFPLTDVQQAYWLGRSSAFELGNIACHVYAEVDAPDLDTARFENALNRLVARHDMLRAIILPDGRQQILPSLPIYHVRVHDLRGVEADTLTLDLQGVREEMSHQVLPTDRAPLVDVRATRLTEHLTRLHFSMDVLIADAWSLQVLFDELATLYFEPTTELEPLALSFRDYVLAVNELDRSATYRRAQAYWLERLPALFPPPELPLALNPSAIKTPRFKRRHAELSSETWARLQARAARAGMTPSGIALAAFVEVLTTWSKSPRFTVNLTLYNRLPLHPQVDSIIGDFTSTTLLAVDNSCIEPFETRARRIQEQLWQDLDQRAYSAIRVLREMARAQGGTPNAAMPVIFTSTLNLGPSDGKGSPLTRLGQIGYAVNQTPQTWLDNQVSEEGGALVVNWDAVEALFPTGVLDDMFAAYCSLLQQLANEPTRWQTSTLDLLPAGQRAQRAAVNAISAPIPEGLLHQPFQAQARSQPEAPAIITTSRTLTYSELASRASHLALHLRAAGARPNTLVAIVMEKGWEQVAAALGILESGAAYLPIDAALPQERIWHLLRHGEVEHVLTQSWVERAKEWPTNVRRVCVDEESFETDALPLEPVQLPDDLAYVIYTSGSTGQPKGVMIDHQGALNTCVDINTRFNVASNDRVLALSSLSFDLSVYDIFGTLAAGGSIVIPDAAASRDPAHWAELATRERITIWNSVPALMELLVDFAEQQGTPLPEGLRVVMMSGDWIPVSLPGRIQKLLSTVELYSLGGATEASIWSILYPIEKVDPSWTSIPYGKPMVNQTFHVLNERLEPCPTWVTGELFIGGVGLARGYWRDAARTESKFFVHPRTGERLYRTGDLGRYLPDSHIEFLGREDFQVKIQGFRIELGEIESALMQHRSVRAAVVTAVGERHKNKHLVAYVVPERDGVVNPGDLRQFMQGKLPEYMVPSIIMLLDSLPLSSNGKVDRRALPAPEEVELASERIFVAPRTPIEQTLAAIWAEDLGVPQMGIYDNVFEMGGDSLIGTRAILRIRRAFQVNVPVRSLFDAPTIAELALVIQDLILKEIEAMPESEAAKTALI